MWYPVFIRFKNLFSHSDTTYTFKNRSMTIFLGENEDDHGSDSNGAGKSTIIEAITLAITGDVYRKVKKDDYVKHGEKFTEVDFELRNDVLNQTLNIKRKIFNSTTSSKIEVYIDNAYPKEIPTATNGGLDINIANRYIFQALGISKEDFLNYYVIGQGNKNSFFTANDTIQKEIISRFSNFTEIDAMIANLELEDKLLAREVNEIGADLSTANDLIKFFKEEIAERRNNFKSEKETKISDKKTDITNCINRISILKEKIATNKLKIAEKQGQVNGVKIENVDSLQSKIKIKTTSLTDKKKEIRECESIESNLNRTLGEKIECPACQHEFIPDNDLSVEDIKQLTSETAMLVESLETEKESLEKEIGGLKSKVLKVDENKSKKRTLNNEISSFTEILEGQESDLKSYEKKLKRLQDELISLKKLSLNDELNEIKSKLKTQEEKRETTMSRIQSIQERREGIQFHIFHFGKKGFKTYLANKSIRNIQDICNFYLQKFDTNLQVQISGFTILKSGEVRDKIEISVLKDGKSKGLFHKYSGGEKSRVDVAGIIAINRLINNGCGDRGLDLLILDENVSYLDSTGQNEIIKILSKSGITTILVMHQIDDIPYKNKVIVRKQKGNSTICLS